MSFSNAAFSSSFGVGFDRIEPPEVVPDTRPDGAAGFHGGSTRRSVVVEDRFTPETEVKPEPVEEQKLKAIPAVAKRKPTLKVVKHKPLPDTFEADREARERARLEQEQQEQISLANEIQALEEFVALETQRKLARQQEEEEFMLLLLLEEA